MGCEAITPPQGAVGAGAAVGGRYVVGRRRDSLMAEHSDLRLRSLCRKARQADTEQEAVAAFSGGFGRRIRGGRPTQKGHYACEADASLIASSWSAAYCSAKRFMAPCIEVPFAWQAARNRSYSSFVTEAEMHV